MSTEVTQSTPEVDVDFDMSSDEVLRFVQKKRIMALLGKEDLIQGGVTILRDLAETATAMRKMDLENSVANGNQELARALIANVATLRVDPFQVGNASGITVVRTEPTLPEFNILESELEVGVGSIEYEEIFDKDK